MNYNRFNRKNTLGEDWKLVDEFNSTYWSGQDLAVYANNIFLEEAIQLNYQIIEQVRPYYGYASYIAQRFHHGSRIITGELSLNFKQDGYIFSLMEYLRRSNDFEVPGISTVSNPTEPVREATVFPFDLSWDDSNFEDLNSEELEQIISNLKATRDNDLNNRRSLLNFGDSYEPNIPLNSGVFETKNRGFDLTVVYGTQLTAKKALRFNSTGEFYTDGVTYEQNGAFINCTGIKLLGVSIMGQAKSLNDSGQGIIETYNFQARDIQVLRPAALRGASPATKEATPGAPPKPNPTE